MPKGNEFSMIQFPIIDDKDFLSKAADALKDGGILIFPTDTVYGIGCLLNTEAIKKLYKIKNRPLSQPTAVLMSQKLYHFHRTCVKSSIEIPKNIKKDFFRGRLTIIFPLEYFNIKFPKIIISDSTVGVRLPKYLWLEKLIDKAGLIVATSANRRGERPPKKFAEIESALIRQVDLTIRTAEILKGKPSSVYAIKESTFLRD